MRNIKLEKSSLNKKQTLQTNSGSFRTLLVKVPRSNPDPLYSGKYVLILQNIDSELQSINVFRKSLILTVVFLWLLAVIFSFILTVWAMRPINRSWQRQREFTADAAHELRAPLAVIQSQQEYLLIQPNKQVIDVADEIAKSLTEISRLQTLTNDLLLLARTDAAQLNLNLTLVKNMNWLQEIAKSQKKSLVYQIDKQATLKIDMQRLKQVCVILLSNALQYTSSGDSIWINAKENEKYLQIEIGNTGMPLAASDRPHIFERFYRGDTARNKYSGGNGLGLTIAQWIVNQHHGKIRVEDAHPKGVKFIVTLPLAHA
ncbi:sensor histidine kinase [Agrilactobacillus fermenti]|uniref:sensor histidine kinase n=1 Tax=Agrilactobacillus fermenti TaxID=2586909 RepID=UPI001E5E4D16|nr:HAMP domain-containing sensor histidine kinase [Agrilactobacillus fermenti]MCD2257454.1 HAMP domain-containing histidine kinase [Agrilactobacillus fermenti]